MTGYVDKEMVVDKHFCNNFGRPNPRIMDFNYLALDIPPWDLEGIDAPLSKEEVCAVIMVVPRGKAPGPDGYTKPFFKSCCDIIAQDFITVVNLFTNLQTINFLIVLILHFAPLAKKDHEEISDLRHINLIHAIVKIIAKVMAANPPWTPWSLLGRAPS